MLIKDECLQPHLDAVKMARAVLHKAALGPADGEESKAAIVRAEIAYLLATQQLWEASEVEFIDGW